jgi:hypothetical protein
MTSNRDSLVLSLIIRPEGEEEEINFFSLIIWPKETFCTDFSWVNDCCKYDPEMKHETISGLD